MIQWFRDRHPGNSFLSVGILYACLLAMINTLFFPTVQESLSNQVEVHSKTDSSLMEVVMECFFDVSDDATEHHDDEDDVTQKEEYLSPITFYVAKPVASAARTRLPRDPAFLKNTTLENPTPPPKGVTE